MSRPASRSVLVPAVDRGASLRRPVVPGRSRTRRVLFLALLVLLATAAVWLYQTRWQDSGSNYESTSVAAFRPIIAKVEEEKKLGFQPAPLVAFSPIAEAEKLAQGSSVELSLEGLSVEEGSLLSPDGKVLALQDPSGEVTLCVEQGMQGLEFASTPTAMAFSADSSMLACGFAKGEIVLVEVADTARRVKRRVHRGEISDLRFIREDFALLSSAADGFIRESLTSTLVEARRRSFGEPLLSIHASSAEGMCWALGEEGALRAFSLLSFEEVASTQLPRGASVAVAQGVGVVTFAEGEMRVHDFTSLMLLWRQDGFDQAAKLGGQSASVSLQHAGKLTVLERQGEKFALRKIDLGAKAQRVSLAADLSSALLIDESGQARRLRQVS